MSPDDRVIDVRDLVRRYGRLKPVEAVRGVSFRVGRGQIYGLIGPDGAGKTSIIQMLVGVLRPHGGGAFIDGVDVVRDAERVRNRIGYMPQGLGSNLYDTLTARENIEFFRDLRKLPRAAYERNRAELLAATRLEPFLNRRAVDLSGGMRQKLALICTLIHLPEILLLDEPTTGVDPISRQDFWQIVRRVVEQRQTTVLLSTSYMDEAERCHQIALLHRGVIVSAGTPEQVRQRATGRFAELVATPQPIAREMLRSHPSVESTEVFGDAIHIRFQGELRDVEQTLSAGGIAIERVAIQQPSLEDVFLQLLTGSESAVASVQFTAPPALATGAAVTCTSVTRRFGNFTAVDNVTLAIRRGEIFGLLGPNGAGKTTLIKMLCGLLEPSAGAIEIGGLDLRTHRERLWTALGYMSQRFSLYQDLTVEQNLRLFGDLYGLEASTYADLTAWLGLDPFRKRLTKDLPGGVRQRLSLLCAVLQRPSTVLLDEPTSGVDPQARRVFWDLIYSLSRDAGVTVLVSTHYMDEAAHCDRLALMHQGRLVADGSPQELRELSVRRSGTLLAVRTGDSAAARRALAAADIHPTLYGDHLRMRSEHPDDAAQAVRGLLARAGLDRVTIDRVPLSMDDVFIDLVAGAGAVHA